MSDDLRKWFENELNLKDTSQVLEEVKDKVKKLILGVLALAFPRSFPPGKHVAASRFPMLVRLPPFDKVQNMRNAGL